MTIAKLPHRRQFLHLAAGAAPGLILSKPIDAAAQLAERSDVQRRIGAIIHEYEEQGFHRTGTTVDQISGDWLASEVSRSAWSRCGRSFR